MEEINLSTTGIIRRIDELGRIVIPKELRKNLRIKNGDNLEILVDGENITLKKYSQIENLESIANMYAESFYQVLKYNVIVVPYSSLVESLIVYDSNPSDENNEHELSLIDLVKTSTFLATINAE